MYLSGKSYLFSDSQKELEKTSYKMFFIIS